MEHGAWSGEHGAWSREQGEGGKAFSQKATKATKGEERKAVRAKGREHGAGGRRKSILTEGNEGNEGGGTQSGKGEGWFAERRELRRNGQGRCRGAWRRRGMLETDAVFCDQRARVIVALRNIHQIARQQFEPMLDLLRFFNRSRLLFAQPLTIKTRLVSNPQLPPQDSNQADGD